MSYYMVVWGGGGGGGGGGGVGKIVKYRGMSNDRSSDKKSHKVRFEQALFKQIGLQLLYGLPVISQDSCGIRNMSFDTLSLLTMVRQLDYSLRD